MQSAFRIDWPSHPLSKKTLGAPRLAISHRRHTAVTCLVINFQTSRVPLGTRIPATYCCCIIYKENPTLSARKVWHVVLPCLFQWYKNDVQAPAGHSSSLSSRIRTIPIPENDGRITEAKRSAPELDTCEYLLEEAISQSPPESCFDKCLSSTRKRENLSRSNSFQLATTRS